MNILIAEDDEISKKMLQTILIKEGHATVAVEDGAKALEAIQRNIPDMLITDWMMPELDGPELCRRVRSSHLPSYVYIILLTALNQKEKVSEGLNAGADDYVTKPYARTELLARVKAGERVLRLERSLRQKNEELIEALVKVKQLKGLLPICMYCKKIRKDDNYWQQIEQYLVEHSEADFSHSICPQCMEEHFPESLKRKKERESKVGN